MTSRNLALYIVTFFILYFISSVPFVFAEPQKGTPEWYRWDMERAQKFHENRQKKGDCEKYIELHSAKYMGKEYGQSEMWVLSNVKINLWEKETPKGKGKKVGSMIPGSRALIIEEGADDYKVKSPLDGSIGWINKMQVSRTLYQDKETRKPCK